MDGYEYTDELFIKLGESENHTLSLRDACDYVEFYGLRDLINAQGKIRIVGHAAIDAIDRAIQDGRIAFICNPDEWLCDDLERDVCVWQRQEK